VTNQQNRLKGGLKQDAHAGCASSLPPPPGAAQLLEAAPALTNRRCQV
jgi:hypothetical protein